MNTHHLTDPPPAAGQPARTHGWARGLSALVAVLLLMGVFSLYLQPDFLLTLADQLWACF
ncbi:MAG: hypothetical protein ACOVO0_16775 [Burkholderiaceae bacterium]